MDVPGTALSLLSSSSLIAGIFGALQGQVGSLFHKWLDHKYRLKHLKSETYLKDKEGARNISNPSTLITRRILAVSLVLTFCLLHLLPGFMNIGINVFYIDSNGLWGSITKGSSSMYIKYVTGFLLSPDMSYIVGLVSTMYFGKIDK